MEQAPVSRTIIRQCLADGIELPSKFANAPRLWPWLKLYWDAFWDLTTCRSSGLSVAPIPWSAVRDYAETFEFDDEQTSSLYFLVRAMDNAYMDYRARKKE